MFLKLDSRWQKSKAKPRRSAKKRVRWRLLVAIAIAGIGFYLQNRHQAAQRPPQAVFVLGGLETREAFAARLARNHPDLEIWVSSGSPKHYVQMIFDRAGVERDRLHLDYAAQDTVTNFTSLVDDLRAAGVDSVYLITSDNHMRRARIIGEIVFGSRGIAIQPLPVQTDQEPEPWSKSIRDGARAVLWLFTGSTGEELAHNLDVEPLREWVEPEQRAE
ncbi:YdcF family protein [Spirulina subsalsa]|uniref:YdcF family protein n=1 Tax=Spirulina subsalsa TaxID=54311 RepID=UPI0022381D2D|nr:YdcF family protein [Spirulina subsalsa]